MIFPEKLKEGDLIKVIAPSRSMAIISDGTRDIANKRFGELGFKLDFSKHCEECDDFVSSSVKSRLEDIHEAFSNSDVKGIMTVIGGFNSNQLLSYLDYKLIKSNPKILCGYSDITALSNAIYAKTGLVTYSGPHYSTFGMKKDFDYNMSYFKKCLMLDEAFEVKPSENWSDDDWYLDQENRTSSANEGYWCINEGEASGKLLGGNLSTFSLLFGTEYMPDIGGSILFLEDDLESRAYHFDRLLQSLIHQDGFCDVKGMVIGRFQKDSRVTRKLLEQIIKSKKELKNIPVIGNANFGHTNPMITYPIGGEVCLKVCDEEISLNILKH